MVLFPYKGGKSLLGGGPQEDDLGRAMKVTAWAMRAKPFGCHVSRWALHLCGFQLHTPNSSLSATQTPMQGHSTRYPIGQLWAKDFSLIPHSTGETKLGH